MVWKKMFEKNDMFKMCFKIHRLQKIYLKISFFFRQKLYYDSSKQVAKGIYKFKHCVIKITGKD